MDEEEKKRPTIKDFDTVCYSKQHNIIQIIKYLIGIGDDLTTAEGNITNIGDQVTTIDTDLKDITELVRQILESSGDMLEIVKNLQQVVSIHDDQIEDLRQRVVTLEQRMDIHERVLDVYFDAIKDLQQRVKDLEDA